MVKFYKKQLVAILISLIFIILANTIWFYLDEIPGGILRTFLSLIRYFIYYSLIFFWMVSIKIRVNNKNIRRCIIWIGVFLILWLVIKTCRFEFFPRESFISRFLWYLFYIPIIIVPIINIYLAEYIGKPNEYKVPPIYYFFFIVAAILLILVFTNDYHNLLISFPQGLEYYYSSYKYEPMFIVIAGWNLISWFYLIIKLLYNVRNKNFRIINYLPLFVTVFYVVIIILYLYKIVYFDVNIASVIFTILVYESAILATQIKSNSHYEQLFVESNVGCLITDNNFKTIYMSKNFKMIPVELMKQGFNKDVYKDGLRFHTKKINGGYVIVSDDMSHLQKVLDQINEIKDELNEMNDVLKEELNLREKEEKLKKQKYLHELLSIQMQPGLEVLENLLTNELEKTNNIAYSLAKVCVIGSYIKRRANLILFGEHGEFIDAKELEYCFKESLLNLKLCGIINDLNADCEGKMSIKEAIAIYDYFEALIEKYIKDLTAVMVFLNIREDKSEIKFNLGANILSLPENKMLNSLNPKIKLIKDDYDSYISITILKGDQND